MTNIYDIYIYIYISTITNINESVIEPLWLWSCCKRDVFLHLNSGFQTHRTTAPFPSLQGAMKSHLPSAQGPRKDQTRQQRSGRVPSFLSKHFAFEMCLRQAPFWKKADPLFSNGNHHIQVMRDAMLFIFVGEYTTFSTCTHKPSSADKNTWKILISTLALSTFKAISQFFIVSIKKNIFGKLTFEFLFEPKRKLQKISGNVPSATAPNGSSPKPPPATYVALNSSQVAANHWIIIKGWEVTRFQPYKTQE